MVSQIQAITLIMLASIGIDLTFDWSVKTHHKIRKRFRSHTLRKVYPQEDKGRYKFKLDEVILDERGSITLVGMVVVFLVTTKLLMTTLSMQEINKGMIERSQLHLCFHYLRISTKDYMGGMAKQNIAIKAAHTASFIEPINKVAIPLLKALKIAQQLYHASYMTKLATNRYCSFTQASFFIKNVPYKASGHIVLKRGVDGTARLKHKKWKVFVPSKALFRNSPYGHALVSKMGTSGIYQGKLSMKNYEVGKEAVQNLKLLFGALSSSSWGQQISKLKNTLKNKIGK